MALCSAVGCQTTAPVPFDLSPPTSAQRPEVLDCPVGTARIPASDAVAEGFQRLPKIVTVAYDEPVETGVLPVPPESAEDVSPGELSLETFEQIALAQSPAVSQAAAEVQAAYGNWIQVGLPPNPHVGYSGQQLGSRGLAEQQGVFLGQEIVLGRKLWLNRNVAVWEWQQAERQLTVQQFRVLTDVRIAYCEVVIAQRRVELAEQLVDVGEQAAAAAKSLFDAKEVSEADPLRARIEADSARIVLGNARNQYQGAWRTLVAAAGAPDMLPVRLPDDLQPELVEGEWETLLAQLLAESPEMAARQARVESAHWAVHRAMVEPIPDLDVQAVIQHDNATQSSNGNLQVSVPVPLWNRNQGRIQEARAQLTAAHLGVDRLALDLQTRFADAYQRYENARQQTERYTAPQGILDNARRTMDLIRTGYQAGEFSVLDLLTAQRTFFQTNLAYLDSLRELWVTSMEIRGMLLRGSLAQQ
ncbi:MAG: TolC family protein [Pirellulaceae bacterium]